MATWEVTLSRITHVLLYAFLGVQPLLGLLSVWLGGRGISIPGTELQLPSPLSENHDLHEQLETIHGWIGTVFYYVIGLHIAGALWHHFFRHDNTLRRIT
jgi:cytochrome b561